MNRIEEEVHEDLDEEFLIEEEEEDDGEHAIAMEEEEEEEEEEERSLHDEEGGRDKEHEEGEEQKKNEEKAVDNDEEDEKEKEISMAMDEEEFANLTVVIESTNNTKKKKKNEKDIDEFANAISLNKQQRTIIGRGESVTPHTLAKALTKEINRPKGVTKDKVLPKTPVNTPVEAVDISREERGFGAATTTSAKKQQNPRGLPKNTNTFTPLSKDAQESVVIQEEGEGEEEEENDEEDDDQEEALHLSMTAILGDKTLHPSPSSIEVVKITTPNRRNSGGQPGGVEEGYNQADGIDLTRRLEKLLDQSEDLSNRSANVALKMTMTACDYHYAVTPKAIAQIEKYKKQAGEILLREEKKSSNKR